MAKLNYCIIKGDKHDPVIIYLANNDDTRLDPSVVESEYFHEFRSIIENHGFEHVIAMTFKNRVDVIPKLRPMISELSQNGFIRSRKLEAFVIEQRNKLKAMRESKATFPYSMSGENQNDTGIPTFSLPFHGASMVKYKPSNNGVVKYRRQNLDKKFHIIALGERVELYLYLFLRVNPTEDKSIDFDFECDFQSKDNTELRRYIKMIKCSFIRKESDTDGIMYLESDQTLRDILKSVDFLFYIRLVDPFEILSGQKPKSMIFSSIELKEYLSLDQKISLFININENYTEVISLSEKIRREKAEHDHNTRVPVSLLKKAVINVMHRMEQRMHYYSDEENYELAASYRKNQEYIQRKVGLLDDMEKRGVELLSNQEYEDNFTMKDFDF